MKPGEHFTHGPHGGITRSLHVAAHALFLLWAGFPLDNAQNTIYTKCLSPFIAAEFTDKRPFCDLSCRAGDVIAEINGCVSAIPSVYPLGGSMRHLAQSS